MDEFQKQKDDLNIWIDLDESVKISLINECLGEQQIPTGLITIRQGDHYKRKDAYQKHHKKALRKMESNFERLITWDFSCSKDCFKTPKTFPGLSGRFIK